MLSPGVLSTSTPVVSTNQGKDLFGLPHFHYSGIPSDTKIHLKASRTSHLLDIPVFLEGISSSLPLSSLERPPGSEPRVPSGRWLGHISMLISFTCFIRSPVCLTAGPHIWVTLLSILIKKGFQELGSLKATFLDFLSSPVAKTLHSQCREPGFDPWSGN